jgi:hypothetical protein
VAGQAEDLRFAVFVARILEHLFDGDSVALRRARGENNAEGALAEEFDRAIVGRAMGGRPAPSRRAGRVLEGSAAFTRMLL